jgi:hypothetical protein
VDKYGAQLKYLLQSQSDEYYKTGKLSIDIMNEVFMNMGDEYMSYFLDYIIIKLYHETKGSFVYNIYSVIKYFESDFEDHREDILDYKSKQLKRQYITE